MHDDELSMSSISAEGRDQYEAWLSEHVSEYGMQFVEHLAEQRIISEEQRDLLVREAEARLSEDPYGIEAYTSPWDNVPHTERVYLVSAYHRSRRYGGPEEGGWWYDHHDPLTEQYAQSHGRAFIIAGPFVGNDTSEADEVARDLNAMESAGYTRSMPPSIVWRVQCCVPFASTPMRYC